MIMWYTLKQETLSFVLPLPTLHFLFRACMQYMSTFKYMHFFPKSETQTVLGTDDPVEC